MPRAHEPAAEHADASRPGAPSPSGRATPLSFLSAVVAKKISTRRFETSETTSSPNSLRLRARGRARIPCRSRAAPPRAPSPAPGSGRASSSGAPSCALRKSSSRPSGLSSSASSLDGLEAVLAQLARGSRFVFAAKLSVGQLTGALPRHLDQDRRGDDLVDEPELLRLAWP